MKDRLPGLFLSVVAIGACVAPDTVVQASPPDKGPGEVTLHAPSPTSVITLETPPPGWQEYTSLARFGRHKYRFQVPQSWSIREENEIAIESLPFDMSRATFIRITSLISNLSSEAFAESLADSLAIEDKEIKSPLEFKLEGKKIDSYIKKNFRGRETHIFGFTKDGLGVSIAIDLPSDQLAAGQPDLQRFLNTFKTIPVR